MLALIRKVAIVTGASSGIGRATALWRIGRRLSFVNRHGVQTPIGAARA